MDIIIQQAIDVNKTSLYASGFNHTHKYQTKTEVSSSINTLAYYPTVKDREINHSTRYCWNKTSVYIRSFNHTHKYQTKAEVSGSDKHASLLYHYKRQMKIIIARVVDKNKTSLYAIGSSLAHKYQTKAEVSGKDKHTSLLQHCKKRENNHSTSYWCKQNFSICSML